MSAGPAAAGTRSDPPPLRRNTDFLLLWTGAGGAELGARMSVIAFPLLVIWHTDSPVGAGLVSFAGLLPLLLFQLPAGVLVDRWDRRRLLMLCNAVAAVGMLSVAVALAFGVVWLPHLLLVCFADGTCMVFYRLAERTAVRNVVAPEHLTAAMSQNEARGRAASLIGQPAGSSLYALVWWSPFLAAAVGHLVSLGNLTRVKRPLQTERVKRKRDLRADLSAGFKWLWGQRFLRAATVVVAVTNFLAQIVTMAPLVVFKETGVSAALAGLVGLLGGLGGVCGALTASWVLRRVSLGSLIWLDLGARCVLVPMMAFTTSVPLLVAPFAVMSFTGAMMNVGAGAYMAGAVPDEVHGRAMSVMLLTAGGANSAGALAAGMLLGYLGTQTTLLAVGGVLVVVTVAAVFSPSIRKGPDWEH
ncbi:MFS transporter [Amycolatopsis sp. 195334CR]|uniref:MFS transporter n=1 Tax=Amycolatopsis sp. 195334CR TaxID=2814588 RepID=UPI001A8C3C90|nr:MFS transporter [Amycolatopsis sp. 195334CR]MBN6039753.1 MFS transporter [Amycolatopsis sp. 195334CR]